jgi:hypothetical protein
MRCCNSRASGGQLRVLVGALAAVVWLACGSTAIAGGWIDTVEIAPDGGAQPQVVMTPPTGSLAAKP